MQPAHEHRRLPFELRNAKFKGTLAAGPPCFGYFHWRPMKVTRPPGRTPGICAQRRKIVRLTAPSNTAPNTAPYGCQGWPPHHRVVPWPTTWPPPSGPMSITQSAVLITTTVLPACAALVDCHGGALRHQRLLLIGWRFVLRIAGAAPSDALTLLQPCISQCFAHALGRLRILARD